MVPLVISAYCQWILLSGNGVCRCVKLTDNGLLYLTHSCQSLEELYLYAIPGFVVSTLLSILADITTVWVILCRSNNVGKSFTHFCGAIVLILSFQNRSMICWLLGVVQFHSSGFSRVFPFSEATTPWPLWCSGNRWNFHPSPYMFWNSLIIVMCCPQGACWCLFPRNVCPSKNMEDVR